MDGLCSRTGKVYPLRNRIKVIDDTGDTLFIGTPDVECCAHLSRGAWEWAEEPWSTILRPDNYEHDDGAWLFKMIFSTPESNENSRWCLKLPNGPGIPDAMLDGAADENEAKAWAEDILAIYKIYQREEKQS